MTDAGSCVLANEGRLIHEWMHFFDVYDRHFSRDRGKEVVIPWHSEERELRVNEFTRSAGSVHFCDSIMGVEKELRTAPEHRMIGVPGFSDPPVQVHTMWKRSKLGALRSIDLALRWCGLPSVVWR